MARSCGIRIGPRRYELVVLEGSPKKHRITAYRTGELRGGEDALAASAAALKEAAKESAVPFDNTAIALDTGVAAFRTLKLPFSDREKVAQVIKFEVESLLPQWDVNEVIIDFTAQEESENESTMLVTAVPKSELRRVLGLCEKAGLEPLEAELEATAMVTAALGADICHADDAQVLVHVGELSTSVVVMDGGKVCSMRAIHVGGLAHEAAPEPAGDVETGEGDKPIPEPSIALTDDPELVQRRLANAAARIRREIGRTVSGVRTRHPIEAIYVCGLELPDLVGSTLLDVQIYELDVFEEDSGQPASASPLVVAYGVALRLLGGTSLGASLRREELKFTGALERIELPLAMAALFLAILAGMFCMFEFFKLRGRTQDVTVWRQSTYNFLRGDPAKGVAGALSQPFPELETYLKRTEEAHSDPERSEREQIEFVSSVLDREVKKLESALGTGGEITQPQSALEAVTLVLGVFNEVKDQIGRFALRSIEGQYQMARGTDTDAVKVTLTMSFFAETSVQATENLERLEATLRSKPWVVNVDFRGSSEFEDKSHGAGVSVENRTVTCDLSKVTQGAP